MHFELRWYADGASNLLIEVWDSSASDLDIWCTEFMNFLWLEYLVLHIEMYVLILYNISQYLTIKAQMKRMGN